MEQKNEITPAPLLCPICGMELTEKERTEGGWNCKCGEFIPDGMVIDPKEGLSNQHKQNKIWR
ncbi:MAG: hypothetical protein LLF86_02125 [Nitrospiraceae bacterium]|nr:hypothetical protein [Nitrospiraceae bacterium]